MIGKDHPCQAKKQIIEACIDVARNNGYSEVAGLLRGLLFLETEPISLDELTEETGYSKSTVSSNMSFLETHGLARRVMRPGEKRYRYVAVTNPEVLKAATLSYLKKEVEIIKASLKNAEKDLQGCGSEAGDLKAHIISIRDFYEETERLIDILSKYTSEELLGMLNKTK